MKNITNLLVGFKEFLFACSAEAAEFSVTKNGLPSLVVLSTPT